MFIVKKMKNISNAVLLFIELVCVNFHKTGLESIRVGEDFCSVFFLFSLIRSK